MTSDLTSNLTSGVSTDVSTEVSTDDDASLRVLGFGTYDERMHPRIAVLLDGLADAGEIVGRCNVPLGLDTAARVQLLQESWRLPRLALRLARCWGELAVTAREVLPHPDVVLVGYLGHFDVLLARALFPRTTIVLDHLNGAADTAADRGERGGIKQRVLRLLDHVATGLADIVVVDTQEHVERLPQAAIRKALIVDVGVPDWWAGPDPAQVPRADSDPLRVVFFGLFTPLQGTPAIARAAGLLAADDDVAFTFIGSGQDYEAAVEAAGPSSHVTWIPWVPSTELPALVAEHDVCIGILGTTEKAAHVVPHKVFQGAAAGCAVVTSDTPPQRRVLRDAATYVAAGDSAGLAQVLADLARDREHLLRLRQAAWSAARERFLPAAVTRPLRDLLHTRVRGRRPVPAGRVA